MDFELSDEQRAFHQMASDFAAGEMAPFAAEWDASCRFPVETLRKAAALGLAGLFVNEAHGALPPAEAEGAHIII